MSICPLADGCSPPPGKYSREAAPSAWTPPSIICRCLSGSKISFSNREEKIYLPLPLRFLCAASVVYFPCMGLRIKSASRNHTVNHYSHPGSNPLLHEPTHKKRTDNTIHYPSVFYSHNRLNKRLAVHCYFPDSDPLIPVKIETDHISCGKVMIVQIT